MANVYVEARPKGRPEGSPIQDYVGRKRRVTPSYRSRPASERQENPRPLAVGVRPNRKRVSRATPFNQKGKRVIGKAAQLTDSQMATRDLPQICVFHRYRECNLFAAVAPDGWRRATTVQPADFAFSERARPAIRFPLYMLELIAVSSACKLYKMA